MTPFGLTLLLGTASTARAVPICDFAPASTGLGYGIGQWIDPKSPLIVSSPSAFGFTPWVDRVN